MLMMRRGVETPMWHKTILTGVLLVAAAGCTAPLSVDRGDLRQIEDPRERWESYGVTYYRVDQTSTCFCVPPRTWTALVRSGQVVDATTTESYPGITLDELLERAKGAAWTVEDAFDIIDLAKAQAYRLDVTYHPVYGYPTSFYVDWNEGIADDEILRTAANLQPVRRGPVR
jgi:hypothetical protein